jgi:hypothetical protein
MTLVIDRMEGFIMILPDKNINQLVEPQVQLWFATSYIWLDIQAVVTLGFQEYLPGCCRSITHSIFDPKRACVSY